MRCTCPRARAGEGEQHGGGEAVAHLSVALCVLQQVEEELAALLGPAALRRPGHLRLGVPADAAIEEAEGDGLLVRDDVLQVLLGLLQAHVLDGLWEYMYHLDHFMMFEVTTLRGSFEDARMVVP